MGLLDFLLASHLNGPKAGMLADAPAFQWPAMEPQFGVNDQAAAVPQESFAAEAQAAREAAAKRTKRSVLHGWSPNPLALDPRAPAQPSQNAGDYAGLGDAFGGGELPPSTNDPMSGEPQPDPDLLSVDERGRRNMGGGPGAPLSLAPPSMDEAALPPGATSTEGRAPGGAAEAPGMLATGKGFLDKLLDPNKAATWLALGAGFSGAGSIGTGMRRAFSNAVPAMAADRAEITRKSSVADTYRALVAKGVSPAEALAASQNPILMKAVADKYFDDQLVPHEIGTDWLGNKVMGSFHKRSGKYFNAAGQEIKADGSAVGANASTGGITGISSPLANGVKEYNSELPADEYIAQFSPEVRAGMEAYANGDTMPTSNPRLKGFGTKVKEWATLWGNKAGVPVSDSEFSRKRTMQNQIASSAPNSMGGILSNGKSAFGHLATLSENFVDLGNRSGPDIPGGSWAGRAANKVGNQLLPTPETSGKLEAVKDNAGKYGAEATKFYAGTGGGVEERLSALHGIASPGTLATEQAAYLRTEKDLMLERLHQKEAQIRETMGERWLQQHPVRTPDLQKSIDRIDASIKRLQTGNVGGHTAAPEAAPKLKPGESTKIGDVTIRRLN